MLASNLPLSDKHVLSVFHDRTLWPNNAIVQHLRPTQKAQRSTELLRVSTTLLKKPYYSAVSSNAKNIGKTPAISLVEWIIGFTRSWQFQLIGSIFAVRFEREKGAVLLPGYAPSNSGWSPCGRGGGTNRV